MNIQCPVCSSKQINNHVLQGEFQTVKCAPCELIFTPGVTQAQLEAFYDTSYFNNDGSVIGYKDYIAEEHGHRANALRLLAQVNRAFPLQGKTVLDVGCAAGFLLDEARKQYGCTVSGVEPSAAIHNYARDVLGLEIKTTTLEAAGLAPASCDVVFLIGTIEHLLEPRKVLDCINQLLKPGGLLVLTTIDTKGLLPIYSIKPPEHIIYFSHGNLRLLLQQCGYAKVTHRMQFVTYRAADLFHRLHEFSGLGLFGVLERLTNRFCGNLHWSIPTNEMIVLAQKGR